MPDTTPVSAVLSGAERPLRRTYRLELGAMAEPLSKQLEGTIIPHEDALCFERDANDITRLRFAGLLTPAETDRVRSRLIKSLFKRAEILRAAALKASAEGVE